MSICVVTGFKDLGRKNWEGFERGPDEYFEGFKKLAKECPYPLVAFLEKDERKKAKEETDSRFLKVFPMEGRDLLVYSHWDKDWEIMNSPVYDILMYKCSHDKSHPERSKEGYNMMTCSKSNMLVEAKKECPGFEFYAWNDFGQACLSGGIPKKIDVSKLSKDKITVAGMIYNPDKQVKIDPVGMARTGGATYVCSSHIIVPNEMVEWFDERMRFQVNWNHSISLTDDDQSVLAQTINNFKGEGKFDWVKVYPKWFTLWEELAKR